MAVQKVSTQMAGKIKFVKIDTDKYPKVASRYAIQVCIRRLHPTHCPVLGLVNYAMRCTSSSGFDLRGLCAGIANTVGV